MSWKCDKCKNTYANEVKPVMVEGFAFCPNCVGKEQKVEPIKRRADIKKVIIAILVAALVVLVGAASSSAVLFATNQIEAAVTSATCGFVAVVILSSVAETIRKRNKDFLPEKDRSKQKGKKEKQDI